MTPATESSVRFAHSRVGLIRAASGRGPIATLETQALPLRVQDNSNVEVAPACCGESDLATSPRSMIATPAFVAERKDEFGPAREYGSSDLS